MPTPVRVRSIAVIDEIEARMRRTAGRLAALVPEVAGADLADPVQLRAAASRAAGAAALSRHVPAARAISDELAALLAKARPARDLPASAVAEVVSAEIERALAGDDGALERAAAWAAPLAGMIDEPEAALALARCWMATGEEDLADAAARVAEHADGGIVRARALAALCAGSEERAERQEQALALARGVFADVARGGLLPTGGIAAAEADTGGSDPVADAQWAGLACDLWEAEGEMRYLDALELTALNQMLFEQTDDGAAVAGRSLDGARGKADDATGTGALARSLAAAADRVLMRASDEALVAGLFSNAIALFSVGASDMRCIAATQIPVRGWVSWVFEPARETRMAAPVTAATHKSARRQRMLASSQNAEAPAAAGGPAPQTCAFRVRVPGWARQGQAAPVVKVDGAKAGVKQAGDALEFELRTDRATKIEVIFEPKPAYIMRRCAASWGAEVAVSYGPILLATSSIHNGGEGFAMPARIVSDEKDLELVADIRRRMPLVQAKVLGGTGRLLFSPVAEVGGIAGPPGGGGEVACAPFRAWHRRGR